MIRISPLHSGGKVQQFRITLSLTHTAHMWYDDATHEANTDEDPFNPLHTRRVSPVVNIVITMLLFIAHNHVTIPFIIFSRNHLQHGMLYH